MESLTTLPIAKAIQEVISNTQLAEERVQEIINTITLVDFTEDFEFGREFKEEDLKDNWVIAYTVEADIIRTAEGGNYEEQQNWHTLTAYPTVHDLMIYNGEGEGVVISDSIQNRLETAIKARIEY